MYNLNVNVATGAINNNLLSIENSCTTPKTPEILNSLIAMTNPFDGYNSHRSGHMSGPRIGSCPRGNSDTSSSCTGSPLASPTLGCVSPPSVQHTCSQLIKEGLKLTIQTKRRNTGRHLSASMDSPRSNKMARREEVSHIDDEDDDYDDLFSPGNGLTAEDEERRRRRRERNKIAATKCRLKKRERTVNLVQESEILENQNLDLKNQIQELETQRRRLMDMLSMHTPTCMKNNGINGNVHHTIGNQESHHLQYSPSTGAEMHHDRHTPNSGYCGDSPATPYCHSVGMLDSPNTVANNYHHYSNASCNFSGGYTSTGVDNGCLA